MSGYRSPRKSPHDQVINQAFKLRRQLCDRGAINSLIWQKPKWMRRHAFDKKAERIETSEARLHARLCRPLARLQAE